MSTYLANMDACVAADETALRKFIQSLFEDSPDFFNGADRLPDLKLDYEYRVAKPPIVDLFPLSNSKLCSLVKRRLDFQPGEAASLVDLAPDDPMPPNAKLGFPAAEVSFFAVNDAGQRGDLIEKITVSFEICVAFIVESTNLSLVSVSVDFEVLERTAGALKYSEAVGAAAGDGDCFEKLIEYLINAILAPMIVGRVQDLPLPAFEDLFGSRLTVSLTDVQADDDKLSVVFDVTCPRSTVSDASVLLTSEAVKEFRASSLEREEGGLDREALRKSLATATGLHPSRLDFWEVISPEVGTPVDGDGQIFLKLYESGLNDAFTCLLPRSFPFGDSGRFLGIPWKADGQLTIYAGEVDFRDAGSSSLAGGLAVRVKVCFKVFDKWRCISIKPPRAQYLAKLKVLVGGGDRILKLGVDLDYDSIDFEWGDGFPWPLNKMSDLILDALLAIVLGIVDVFTGEFEIDLVKLPAKWPGTSLPANFRFTRVDQHSKKLEVTVSV